MVQVNAEIVCFFILLISFYRLDLEDFIVDDDDDDNDNNGFDYRKELQDTLRTNFRFDIDRYLFFFLLNHEFYCFFFFEDIVEELSTKTMMIYGIWNRLMHKSKKKKITVLESVSKKISMIFCVNKLKRNVFHKWKNALKPLHNNSSFVSLFIYFFCFLSFKYLYSVIYIHTYMRGISSIHFVFYC